MHSHDALWKGLLEAFLPEFLELAVPKVAAHLELEQLRFLDKEAFADLPKGRKALLDLLAEVPSRDGARRLVLVHVEVERSFGRAMDRRMARYYFHLCLKYDRPVVPVVLFLRGGKEMVELRKVEHEVAGFVVNRFSYWSLAVSRAAARTLLARGALGVALASCARADRLSRDEQKYLCLEALLDTELDEARKELLITAIETYLPLNEEQKMKYAERVSQSPRRTEMRKMELTWAGKLHESGRREGVELGRREGIQQGVELGRQQGVELGRREGVELGRLEESRRMLRLILSQRFGADAKRLETRLDGLDDRRRIEAISRRALGDVSLDEIERLVESMD